MARRGFEAAEEACERTFAASAWAETGGPNDDLNQEMLLLAIDPWDIGSQYGLPDWENW